MARNKGTFQFAANFEVKLQGLLDPRGGVTNKNELINKETFPYDGDTIYMKEGMLVTVSSTQEVYMLVSLDNILAEDYSGWKRIDAGAAQQLEVVDNLESTSTTAALSANQGKELKALIDANAAKLTSIYTPKGSVATYEDLPTEGNTVGDVYNVESDYVKADGKYVPAGTNYFWNGTEWDSLGGQIDLSNYNTKEEITALIKAETDRAEGKEAELLELIQSNESAISEANVKISANETQINSITQNIGDINTILNGTEESDEDGLVGRLNLVESKNDAQDTRLTNLEKLVSGGEGGEDGTTLLELVNQNTANIEALAKRVEANESAIEILNADSTTEGSVDYKIEQALKWENV